MIFRSGGYFERIYGIGKEKFQACLLSFQCSMEPRQCICERDSSPSPAHALGRSSMGNGLHARIHCADRWESVSDLFPDPSENVPELPFALRWSLPASGCVSVCGCSDLLVFPGKCRIFCVSVPDFMVHEQYLRKSGVRDSSRVGEVPFHRKSLGRFFALRERWRLTGEVCVFFLCGILINSFREIYFGREFPAEYLWHIYPGFLFCAGIFSGGSVWFLRKLPNRSAETDAGPDLKETGERNAEELPAVSSEKERLFCRFVGKLWSPLKDPVFRWVLLYGILFAFFTQAEQPIRSKFQYTITNRDGLFMLWVVAGLTFMTRGGQILAASFAGKWTDRLGTLRVMGLSQILTAFAYLFYIAAVLMPNILFLYGASAVWIFYVGLNVALPKFLMDHAGPDKVSRPAVYGFLSGVGGICGAFFGKSIFDRFPGLLDHYILVFTVFLCVRLLLSLPIFTASGIARKRQLSEQTE